MTRGLKILLIALFLCSGNSLLADYSGKISYSISPESTRYSKYPVINYGPVLVNTRDTLWVNLENTGTNDLYVSTGLPSFLIGVSPNDTIFGNRWQSFIRFPNTPTVIDTNSRKASFEIIFNAGDTIVSPSGWYEALFAIAFAKNDDRNTLLNPPDSMLLRAKKTPYYVAGYDDYLDFDSVYVNPVFPKTEVWRVKNTWEVLIRLDSQNIKPISGNFLPSPFTFTTVDETEILPHKVLYWNMNYAPKEVGRDTGLFKVYYRPEPAKFPDSVDYAFVYLSGLGVKQNLRLVKAIWDIHGDTIEVGNRKYGQRLPITITLQNTGNIPVHATEQKILENGNDNDFDKSEMIAPLGYNGKDLLPDSTTSVIFAITPKRLGDFIARYEINTDLLERKGIHGAQGGDSRKTIYVHGFVRSPIFTVASDTVDFGNIILNSEDCNSNRDTTIKIYNSGNQNLVVSSIQLEPEPPTSKFYVDTTGFTIKPGEYHSLKITCEPGNDLEQLISKLIFYTLDDSVEITLLANGISRSPAELSLPANTLSKPGSIITLPLLVRADQSKPAVFAQNFSCNLIYDRSILEFMGIERLGTAAEAAVNEGDLVENPDSVGLNLSLKTLGGDYFLPSDTLVLLKFAVYFGKVMYTQINIIDPKFGDENCPNILQIKKLNGRVTVDSVCNPDDLINILNNRFDFKVVSPPVGNSELKLSYTLANSCRVEFEIYDSFGNSAGVFKANGGSKGDNIETIDVSRIPSGFYFIRLSSPDYTAVGRFILIK